MAYVPLPEGTLIGDQYVITSVIGSGGFGIVYKAADRALDHYVVIKEYFPRDLVERTDDLRVVPRTAPRETEYADAATNRPLEIDETTAIKYMRADQSQDVFEWGRSRFMEEARTLARLRHASFPQIYRVLQANNTVYMVMELVDGETLEATMRKWRRRPTQAEADAILEPLVDALLALHANKFVHRDISPRNIVLRRADGSPVLLDLGSARRIEDDATTDGAEFVVVSPPYSAPELYTTGAGPRHAATVSDIYSLAVTIYEMIAGRRPLDAQNRTLNDDVTPLAHLAADGSYRSEFLRAVDWGMSLAQTRRPQSVQDWLAGLFPWRNLAGRRALNRRRGRKIFISYRRADSSAAAHAIYGWLRTRLDADDLFFDVDSIPYGVDFRNHIRGSIIESALVLAIIGPKWAPSLKPKPWMFWKKPQQDFVRIELELAIENGIPVLPVLVEGAQVPSLDMLPSHIGSMLYNNAATYQAKTAERDLERLAVAIAQFRD